MSPARLAAEAAFDAPDLPALAKPVAQVTIRKRRLATLNPAPAGVLAAAEGSMVDGEPANPGSRTFRVHALQPQASDAAPPAEPAVPLVAFNALVAPPAPVKMGRARVALDKRPGPVLHVVHELPPRLPTAAEEPSLSQLSEELASVGPILEAIQRALQLAIIDPQASDEWQHLSRRIDSLSQEVQALLDEGAQTQRHHRVPSFPVRAPAKA